MKKIFSTVFLLFALANTALAVEVDVNYYWSRPRCTTCNKMESYTRSAVYKMNDSDVKFKKINVIDAPQDVQEYGLFTKSVVLVKNTDGVREYKNLDKIWDYTRDQESFENYITTEVNDFKAE